VAYCDSRNAPVARLLRRVGMRHESQCVEADCFKGEWATLDGYAVLAREFSSRH
jgi:aminoglycoside 6'-N-acetyltransferase